MPAFDQDQFLGRPLTAHVATTGPTVRPMWFLWEDQQFWFLTGPWARLFDHLRVEPRVAISIEAADLTTGVTHTVVASGVAELTVFDAARGARMLNRYLGSDQSRWDERFRSYLNDDPTERGTMWARVTPSLLRATDLSYSV